MKPEERRNLLRHLVDVGKPGNKALSGIKNVALKIREKLETSNQYYEIETALDDLAVIAHRVHDLAISSIEKFLAREGSLQLTFPPETIEYLGDRVDRYLNVTKLSVKALECLRRIRYHQPDRILNLFFRFSSHQDQELRKCAIKGIEEFATYDSEVFFGDGKNWSGLGWTPQVLILDKIERFLPSEKADHFEVLCKALSAILSAEISGTIWKYDSVSWTTRQIPADKHAENLRNRALQVLVEIYKLLPTIDAKRLVLDTMLGATRTPRTAADNSSLREIVDGNTLAVLRFMREICLTSDPQIQQKIEHDSYWQFYHSSGPNSDVAQVALSINGLLLGDEEYRVFRILIGFESIFHEWRHGAHADNAFHDGRKIREDEIRRFVGEMTSDSYDVWEARILKYSAIQSNDLATFPQFADFLEAVGQSHSDFMIQILRESPEKIIRFIVPILCGVEKSTKPELLTGIVREWIDAKRFGFYLTRFFMYSQKLDAKLLSRILEFSKESRNLPSVSQVLAVTISRLTSGEQAEGEELGLKALSFLTENQNCTWVSSIRLDDKVRAFFVTASPQFFSSVLKNLVFLEQVDYDDERLLAEIAARKPELVAQFFCDRFDFEESSHRNENYEAVPFGFQLIHKHLDNYPDLLVAEVRRRYNSNYGMFIHRGAKFLSNVFPSMGMDFSRSLIEVARRGSDEDILFCTGVLRNFHGEPFTYPLAIELVKLLPVESDLLDEVWVSLQSTGVVRGEFGFAEAYKQKIEEMKLWRDDDSPKVRDFAEKYAAQLEQMIVGETKRAEEGIVLRKHRFGVDEN